MYSNDLKLKAINLYFKIKSYRIIEKLLNIGKSTIHRWVNNINSRKEKNIIEKQSIVLSIKSLIDKNKFITINQIKFKLSKKFNKTFSNTLIYMIIKKNLKYSYKKINKKLYGYSTFQVDHLKIPKRNLFRQIIN